MRAIINGIPGSIYHSQSHQDLEQLRPTYCFVPDEFLSKNGIDQKKFMLSPWPGINTGANPLAVGSHTFPDQNRPVSSSTECPVLQKFLQNLEQLTHKSK